MQDLFVSSITVVNYYKDALTREVTYQKTYLEGVMVRKKVETAPTNNTLNTTDYYSITIPFRDGYIDPYNYARLPNDQMSDYWTLSTEDDLIILGQYEDEITELDIADLLKRNDVGIIRSVSDNTTVPSLKHWRVIAK